MTLLWLLSPVLFWASYFGFTRGTLTRHLGFLHFVYYFVGLYGAAYLIYADRGATNTTFLATKGYTGAGVGGLRVWFWLPRVLLDYLAGFAVVFTYFRMRATGRGGL